MRIALQMGGAIVVGERRIAVADALALLEAIQRAGSVQGVAAELGISYRAAWDRIRALETGLGHHLVQKTRGHGSALTATGAFARDALAAAAAGLSAPLAREARALEARLSGALGQGPRKLALAASHDPLLMDALADWADGSPAVVGSAEAVARLIDGRADAAGFHCGERAPSEAGAPFAAIVADPAIRTRPLFAREQGLLLSAGNPLGIRGLADLAPRRARYVNRQPGSGTRLWFDRLLAERGIPAVDISGYGVEEFTHQAVAAVIAYGAADAGLGARVAAERFGLDFLSIGWETYHLAASASLDPAPLDRLAAAVLGRAARTAGYRAPAAPRSFLT